jgi:mannose-6-phosphate isomerase
MRKIMKLSAFMNSKVWGGEQLAKIKNIDAVDPIGESWEVSTLAEGQSTLGGIALGEFCELSYLVKFIDTAENLSIQVHPTQAYADENPSVKAKTECWLILAHTEGAGIYLGLKPGVTRKEFFTAATNNMAVNNYLNFIPVKKGDFYTIEAGSVHAIGAGVTLCEVQQSSGTTYRVWDWNRMGLDGKPRELHIEESQAVMDFDAAKNLALSKCEKEALFERSGITKLIKHADFKAELITMDTQKNFEITLGNKESLVLLSGAITGDIELNAFESAIVLEAGKFQFDITQNGTSFLVVSE